MLWLKQSSSSVFLQVLMTPLFPLPDFFFFFVFGHQPKFHHSFPVFLSQDLGPRQRLLAVPQFDRLILNPFSPAPSHLFCAVIVTRNSASERGPWEGAKVRSLSEPGPPIYPPWLFGTWPAIVYSLVKETSQSMPGAFKNQPRGGQKQVPKREPGMGAGEGDPILLTVSPGILGFCTGPLSSGWGRRQG